MDTDFFGFQRSKPGTYVFSSDFAAVYFGTQVASTIGATVSSGTGAKAGLVQSCSAAYQASCRPVFEGGSSELYWVVGQSIGSFQCGRVIGQPGLLDGINVSQAPLNNGYLGAVEFKVGRLSGVNTVQAAVKQDVLVMKGCVLTSVGWQFSSGAAEISESILVSVALMKRKQV